MLISIAYLGALDKSIETSLFQLEQIQRLAGTSAGAITATLLGIGYDLNELKQVLINFNFLDFLDSQEFKEQLLNLKKKDFKLKDFGLNLIFNNLFLFKDILKKLNNNYGLFPGDLFRLWIENKINAKLKIKNATFQDLKQIIESNINNNNNLKSIFLIGSNLTTGKYEIFSHLHTPDMIISDAVRISISIPIVFYPHKYYIKNELNKRIIKPNKENIFYVDGGLLNNYPIRIFDTTREFKHTEINYINNETLGFRLVANELKSKYEFTSASCNEILTSNEDANKISSYLLKVVDFYFSSEESIHSTRLKDKQRTIYIDSLGIQAIDFDLNNELKLELINLQSNRNNKVLKLENTINSNSKYALAFLEKGYFSSNLHRIAIKYYDKAIELNPNLAEAYFNKAKLLNNDNESIEKAKQLNPNIETTFNELIQLEHDSEINSIVLLPINKNGLLASCSKDKTIKIWDPTNGNLIKTINNAHNYSISSLDYLLRTNDDSIVLISGSYDCTIKLWNNDFQLFKCFNLNKTPIKFLVILQKTNTIATCSTDNSIIRIWELIKGTLITSLIGHNDYVSSMIVLSDGNLASGSYDSTIKLWNANNNYELIATLEGHSDWINVLVNLSNINCLASGSSDSCIKLWDIETNKLIKTLNNNNNSKNDSLIFSLVLLKDEMCLASGYLNGIIHIWNIFNSDLPIRTLIGHTGSVNCLIVLKDGKLVSCSADKTIRIWNITNSPLIKI
jgi:WD40 repeat protein